MPLPLYQGLDAPEHAAPATMHMGLWFERFFSAYQTDFSEVDKEARKQWLKEFTYGKKLGNSQQLQTKAKNRQLLAASQNGQTRIYHCEGNFVTGLGNPHPLENGFLWHPTLGLPYLPGSAVKGLVRALVETAYHGEDKDQILKRWFGTATKKPEEIPEQSGQFIFLDALPVKPCDVLPEVMTPHMGKWYEKGGSSPMAKDTQPGDWHSPVPVHYLVARDLNLQFAILPRASMAHEPAMQDELANVWEALEKALEWLGAGAKTAIGFGLMQSEEGKQRKEKERKERQAKEAEKNALAWPGASIKFNSANGSLTVEKSGKKAIALAPKGEELFNTLPAAIRQQISAHKFVRVTAYVAGDLLVKVEAS